MFVWDDGVTILALRTGNPPDVLYADEVFGRVARAIRYTLAGKLFLDYRLSQKRGSYLCSPGPRGPKCPPKVRLNNRASDLYTIIDVSCDDRVGLLYDIARTLFELRLETHLAKVMDPRSGDVLACVGGFSFEKSQFNRATQSFRQPGSSFKPIVYSAAMDNGMTPATVVQDAPFSYRDPWSGQVWSPGNYEGDYSGPMTIRAALAKSKNLVTVRVAQQVGMLLQTDPTIIYGLGSRFTGNLTRAHLEDSTNPYNTYIHRGLPPGPICSPGLKSLQAATAPEIHDFYYFVANGQGEHQFSRTLEEHNIAVNKYQRKRAGKK